MFPKSGIGIGSGEDLVLGASMFTMNYGGFPQPSLHFVAGLPRSGSTLLVSLLSQNPRIHGAPVSGLAGIFSGIYANWDKDLFHQEMENVPAKRAVLRATLDAYHAHHGRPIVIDKSRQWTSHIGLLEEVLGRRVKIIVPVRPVVEILTSFEMLRRKNPLELTNVDEALGPLSTMETRMAHLTDASGVVGVAYNSIKEAVMAGYLDRMLFVDYNKFMQSPERELHRVYDFIGEPYFPHTFSGILRPGESDPRVHKFPGLHEIRSRLERTSENPETVLGSELCAKYSRREPWEQWTQFLGVRSI